MERQRPAPEASASRDAPAYDYGSFSGYPTSFSSCHQLPPPDTLPISINSHGGSSNFPTRAYLNDAASDGISENYSYTSSYDDVRRRYGYGSDAGSYLSGPYSRGALDTKPAHDYESFHRPSNTPSMSGFIQDAVKSNVTSEHVSRDSTSDERQYANRLNDRMDTQKNDLGYVNKPDFGYMSKSDRMSYEQPYSGGWQSSEREFGYPPRNYNTQYEQYSSAFFADQDRATIARSDDKSAYGLENRYDNPFSRSRMPFSGPWSDWRSFTGARSRQEEQEWKGSSSLAALRDGDLDRVTNSSRHLDGGTYTGLKEYNNLSTWKDEGVNKMQSDEGQKGTESSLMHTNHVAQNAANKEVSSQVQGVTVPSSSEVKKRQSRWEPVVESKNSGQDGTQKQKKKSRWSSEKSPGKEAGQANILKELASRGTDIVALRARLIVIDQMLRKGHFPEDPKGERSPSPEPVFDAFGFRVNTREHRTREKLNKERQRLMATISEITTSSKPGDGKSSKLQKKIYIPSDKYPDYNFIGLIIGPRGNTQKQMEREAGARIFIRGKGSGKGGAVPLGFPEETDNLHVLIEAETEESIKRASTMVERLLVPVADVFNEHKRMQLRELASIKGTLRDDSCVKSKEVGHLDTECPGVVAGVSTIAAPAQKGGAAADTVVKECSLKNENANTVLHVESLPSTADEALLLHLFSPFGKIVKAELVRHPTAGASQNFGSVKFLDAADAAQAAALMNGYQVSGKVLLVKFKPSS